MSEIPGYLQMALLDYTVACQTGTYTFDAQEREAAKGVAYRALADAIAAHCCGTCEFYDANSSATEGVGYCTNANSWHRAKAMPPHEMCSKWAARVDE